MSTIIITADSGEPDWLFASTVRAMRRSLDATEDQLARVSGIGRERLETIETPVSARHAASASAALGLG